MSSSTTVAAAIKPMKAHMRGVKVVSYCLAIWNPSRTVNRVAQSMGVLR